MILSMTGFARASAKALGERLACECAHGINR